LFIFGESYAGKFVPAIAEHILRGDKVDPNLKKRLKGIGMGDGFTDPIALLQKLGDFAINYGLID